MAEAVRGSSRGRAASAANRSASARPQKIRNGASNESRSAVTPPRAGPAIDPALVAPRATPSASPRRSGGAVGYQRQGSDPARRRADPLNGTSGDQDADRVGDPDQDRADGDEQEPGDQQGPTAERVGRASEGQRQQRDRDGVGCGRKPEGDVTGARALLDVGQQRGDQPEQRRVDRHRPDGDRDDRTPARRA
jgi:hypothetical protein